MKKLKFFLLCVFSAGLFGMITAVSAQTTAKPSKTDVAGMIEFYEWAFETDFSAAQRVEFQRLLEKDFRDDAAKARKDTDTVIGTFAKIKQVNAEARRETRRVFLENFLADLRRNESSDEGASFLIGVYRDSHNGSDKFTTMDAATGDVFDKRANRVTTGTGEANIYGKWSRGVGSGYVDHSGMTKYKSGDTYIFEFLPDGTAIYAYEKDVLTMLQCKIKENNKANGTVKVNGNTMTINLGAMTSVGTDSCDRKGNFQRTLEPSVITKKFTVKRMDSIIRPDKPLLLCFEGQKDEDCFERVTK